MTRFIVVCYMGELFKIPTTFDLMELNSNQKTAIHVHPQSETGGKEIQVKHLFATNDMIFQLYLQKSIQQDLLHPNFFMYVDEILYYIKLNSLREEVSDYWKKLLK
jgi:hypothetical protein